MPVVDIILDNTVEVISEANNVSTITTNEDTIEVDSAVPTVINNIVEEIHVTQAIGVHRAGKEIAGMVTGVVLNNNVVVASFTPSGSFLLRGFNGTGDGDTFFSLKVNGLEKTNFLTHILTKTANQQLPTAEFVPIGSEIRLEAKNVGRGGPITINGVIQGEEIL